MATFRTPKQGQADYFRQLDRDLDSGKPMVYVIQERRALRDMARDLGVEFIVGDPESIKGGLAKKKGVTAKDVDPGQLAMGVQVELEHTSDPKLAKRIALDHLAEDAKYYSKLKQMEAKKSQGPELVVVLEKAEEPPAPKTVETETPHESDSPHPTGEERWPHQYIKRYKGQSGKWVYVYHEAQAKQPGFNPGLPEKPEAAQPPPDIGVKRQRVMQEAEARGKAYQDPEAQKQHSEWRGQLKEMLKVPGVTQKVLQEALNKVGPEEFERKMTDTQAHFSKVGNEHDHALMVEHTARTIVGTEGHSDPQVGKPEPSKFSKRPGGYVAESIHLRQPWQLTSQEFKDRKLDDPRLMGSNYEQVITSAMKRGEYVPAHVLTQEAGEEHPWLADAAEGYLKDKKPEMKMTDETKVYVQKFDEQTEELPKTFDEWVSPDAKREGDSYLTKRKASGYNIDAYDVTDEGIYAHALQHPDPVVLYHMTADKTAHGRELLALLHEHGIDSEYGVVRRASATVWDEATMGPIAKGAKTKEIEGEGGEKKTVVYSSDYVVAFRPKDQVQAEGLVAMLHDYAHRGPGGKPHQAIHGSHQIPDVRSTKKVDHYQEAHLNIKSVGTHDLVIMTKNDWIRSGDVPAADTSDEAKQDAEERGDYDQDFRREKIFVDGDLSRLIKSMEEVSQISVGEVVTVDF